AGSASGTAQSLQPSPLTAAGNLVFFFANDGSGTALWRSDGTVPGTFALRSVKQPFPTLIAAGSYVLYYDETKTLIRSDGTVDGTGPAPDLAGRFAGENVSIFAPLGDALFAYTRPFITPN